MSNRGCGVRGRGGRGGRGRGYTFLNYTPHVTNEHDIPDDTAYTFGRYPFSGSGNVGLVPYLRFDGVHSGYTGCVPYESIALVYHGTDGRDTTDQRRAWTYLTQMLADYAGYTYEGQEYLWVHETTKRMIMGGLGLGPYNLRYHFRASDPSDLLSAQVIDSLYEEAANVQRLSYNGGLPTSETDSRHPRGLPHAAHNSQTHHFELSLSWLNDFEHCRIEVAEGLRQEGDLLKARRIVR